MLQMSNVSRHTETSVLFRMVNLEPCDSYRNMKAWFAMPYRPGDYIASTEPISEEPISKEPISKEPISKEHISKGPIFEEPIFEEPISKEPISKEPIS
jgi:hypothetical protein